MRRAIAVILFLLLLPGHASMMESASFKVQWDSINIGGDDSATSTNFALHDTLGETGTGIGSSENFQASAGYRAAEASTDALSLIIRAQETATQTSYTSFQNAGLTVTVSAASAFSVGDYIGVVEDLGFSQKVAVGKITAISGTVMSVDTWNGDQASMSATPSGGDDYVYRLGGSAVSFGTIYPDSQHTVVAMTSAVSTGAAGYTVYVQTNQPLQAAAGVSIPATTDGTVTAGGDEYGMHATGTTALNTTIDVGVNTTQTAVQSSATASAIVGDRIAMTYKLSVTSLSSLGSYSQNIYYTLTANF